MHRPVFFYFMDWCTKGAATYPQQKALFERQRARIEAEIDHMIRVLDMLRFTCRYYDQAMQDDGEDRVKSMIPGHLPEEIRQA